MDRESEAAFRDLVALRGDALARTGYLLTGDWARGEDLAQTALAITWEHWRSLRATGAAEAYARTCMARLATTWWRRRWRAEVPTPDVPEQVGESPYDAVDIASAVTAALAGLTARQRAVVVLRYFDDLSEAETAAALGCALGTVKSTHAAALAKLRAMDVWDGFPAREATA